jgi:hypothetical protein
MLVRAKRVAARAVAVALPVALAACSSSMPEPPTMVLGGAVACPFPEPSAQPRVRVQPEGPDAGTQEVMGEVVGEPPMLPVQAE